MKRTRAEKNPGEASERERRHDLPHRVSPRVRDEARDRGHATTQVLRRNGRDEIKSVERAPDNECPVRAMPQTTQEKRHEEIEIPAGLRDAVTPERNVDVISKPCRQRDVPSRPEIADG